MDAHEMIAQGDAGPVFRVARGTRRIQRYSFEEAGISTETDADASRPSRTPRTTCQTSFPLESSIQTRKHLFRIEQR
jgi:hypothetical protein